MAKSMQPCLEMSKSIVTLPWSKCYLYSNIVESQWVCDFVDTPVPFFHMKNRPNKSEKKRWSRSTKRLRYHRCVLPHCYKRPIHIGSICLELGSQWLGQWLKCFQMVPTRSNLLQSERIRFAKDPLFSPPVAYHQPRSHYERARLYISAAKKKNPL